MVQYQKLLLLKILGTLAIDACHLGRETLWILSAPLLFLAHRAANQFHSTSSTPEQRLDQQTTMLEFRCLVWMLQTSLDKAVHLSTLKHLATMTAFTGFDPTLVAGCFNAFLSCIRINFHSCEVAIVQGSEQLALVSARCFIITSSHLLATDPTSSILKDVHQCFRETFPAFVPGHQSYNTVNAAQYLLFQHREYQSFQWSDYQPSPHEHTMVAHNLLKVAQFGFQRTQEPKVSCKILSFALHSLSLDPPPPTSVIADCLSIIAIDLGCDIPDTGTMVSDQRYVHI